MTDHEKLNYVEFPARDRGATKQFFGEAFSWTFEDYGPEYAAFSNEGLDGGFFRSELSAKTENGSALLVFYNADLEQTKEKVLGACGVIEKDIFAFPGGRRFHFLEPSGNEFAACSDNGC
ncbi:MAG: putative enzyme related to lactoylglutathione lyase [Gammaproteobacteria bacterium]|jgi:predicted enzyme related to lactoylglutathione lyase